MRLKTIVAMFNETSDARRAVYDLEEAKVPQEDISVAMRERYDSSFGSSGGLLSLAVGNQASTTPMDHGRIDVPGMYAATEEEFPGFGPIVAAGPLARGLGGAALGVAAGGLAGALSDIGIPNETARDLVDRVRSGKETMLCIQVERTDVERIEKIFLDNHATEVYRGTDHTGNYDKGRRSSHAAEMGF